MSEAYANENGSVSTEGVTRPVLLRAAREAAGLHIAALAAALKVPVRKLEALEAGRYEELPDLTFARALAASACRQLKIDPAPVLEQIPHRAVSELGGSRQGINATFQPANDPAPGSPLGWLSRPALLAAIVLLLAALVIVFMPRLEEGAPVVSDGGSVVTPVETATVTEPVLAEEPSEPVVAPAAPADAAAPVDGAAAATGAGVAVPSATPAAPAVGTAAPTDAAAAPAPVVTPGSGLLSIAATGESWVEVTNGSGAVVVQRLLKAGDVIDFSSAPPYKVVLGRADTAQVSVRGQVFETTRHTRNNVARFEVK
ncbi:RodZ domain-containing protein [Hydrogenophaga palleronii]|uniref:RodZ domain-containing protein n=1 Tax=Hydrogenophaga palleronii TaxID=65655 RepID=UPI000A05BED2|nr:RodZ domain-containing protein [Hydrogenophaga palleronii]